MTLIVTDTYDALSSKAAFIIIEQMRQNPQGLYCFAGGDTPIGTLKLLVKAHHERIIDLHQAYYVELDEWVGLDKNTTGSCADYLYKNFFAPANIPESQIYLFDAKNDNLASECRRMDSYITEKGGISLSLLGVGVNGHVGFNEPGVNAENNAHLVDLAEETKKIGVKYFKNSALISGQGITLGLKQLLASEVLVVVANGESKQEAVEWLTNDTVTNAWPISYTKRHQNRYIVVDRAAYKH